MYYYYNVIPDIYYTKSYYYIDTLHLREVAKEHMN